jgi:hypothetical protein
MKIKAEVGYICGHLRYGHFEMTVPDKDLEEFKSMSDEEKKDYLTEMGELVVDSMEIEDWGDLGEVKVIE